MPWIPPGYGQPARYSVPPIAGAASWDAGDIDWAKAERKAVAQQREWLLGEQKTCAAAKDYEGAKFFGSEASAALKSYRGWDACVRWLEGDEALCTWRFEGISEQIAPFVDVAFNSVLYGR